MFGIGHSTIEHTNSTIEHINSVLMNTPKGARRAMHQMTLKTKASYNMQKLS